MLHSEPPMSSFSLLIWYVDALLVSGLVLLLWHRRLVSSFPAFFLYLLVDAVSTWALMLLKSVSGTWYFYGYWMTDALLYLLAIYAIREVFVQQLSPIPRITRIGKIAFNIAALLATMLAVATAFHESAQDRNAVVAAVLTFERSLRIIQGLLLLFTIISSIRLGLPWKLKNAGLATGFGVLIVFDLANSTFRGWYGPSANGLYIYAKPVAFALAATVWLLVLSGTSEKKSEKLVARAPLDRLKRELEEVRG